MVVMISQNKYPDSVCPSWMNHNVPFGQKRIAFQACFHRPHHRLAQRYTLCIDFPAQLDHWLYPFPRHPRGPLPHRLHIDQLGTVPMQFHHPPTALNGIILAVIGRVRQQVDRLPDRVDTLHHATEKWGPHTAAFRALVHCDLHAIARALLYGAAPLPPRRQRIDDKIARFEGTTARHIQLRRIFVDDPPGDIFCLAPQVMITGLVCPAGAPPVRERPDIDRRFPVHAHAFDLLRVLSPPVFFLYCHRGHRLPCSFAAAWL